MIFVFLGVGLFFGIMIPTLMLSAMPYFTIKILELFRIYPQGTLTIQSTTYIAGSGYYRQGKVYTFNDETHSDRFDNGRVFGFLLICIVPVMLVVSILAFFISLIL